MSPSHHMANFGPVTSADRFRSLEHPSKFQRVSSLGFVTAATSLTGGQPNSARCLAVSCAGTPHFRGLLIAPWSNFYHVQNSLCVQILRSPILAALLHGTPAAGSAKLCGVEQRAPPIFGRAAITLGIGPHSTPWDGVSQKGRQRHLNHGYSLTLSILDRFAKFFHCCKQQ